VLGVEWQVRCEHEGGDPTESAKGGATQSPRPSTGRQRPSSKPSGPTPAEDRSGAEDEDAMLAEAAEGSAEPTERRDPEEAAIELLSAQLGARAVDGT
jgi:DNA polymerase-3 subunit gamma/tau